ncbi:metalloregulator ArsR/SmtB family transcription factor [Solirubrobacter phytolaccae]|uniref:Metalloregulator ArsR/SmtB family transcription factor n=1 Tax=Solirubrobacter phytolaccae TaxID=1404360 RepID=A0A9X3S8Z9_9ACTN|nr:metalloregulator ArsR/SmtB family transcription factor [Solirubrobacter phytolaccae]MDA0180996.1 metalloregulator ArsR/SmtB family transcription factor [Solirubrobacter phytolaccae]
MPYVPVLKAEFFKAIGHPIRIRVLELLSEDEQSVSDLLAAIDVGQAHLSQQLGVLRRAGLVHARREGSHVLYALTDARMAELLAVSRQMLVDMATATRDELLNA